METPATPETKVQFFTLRGGVIADVEKNIYSKGNPVGMIAYQFQNEQVNHLTPEKSKYYRDTYGYTLEYQVSSFNPKDVYDDTFARRLTETRMVTKPIQIVRKEWPTESSEIIDIILADIKIKKTNWFTRIQHAKVEKAKGGKKSLYKSHPTYNYGNISQRFVDAVKDFKEAKEANTIRLQIIREKKDFKSGRKPIPVSSLAETSIQNERDVTKVRIEKVTVAAS